MKKSLWIAMAAMAVGYGMSAHAVTNSVFGAWSFEGLSAGTPIPSTAAGALAEPYGTWSADTNNGTAYITSATPTGVSFPLPSEAHAQALYFDGSVTNHFLASALEHRFVTDFLLKPGQLEDLSLLNQVDASARMAFYFDTNGYFNLLHGDGTPVWVTSTFSTVVYDSNAWVRVTIDQDYDARPDITNPGFTIALNGTNLTHANGWTRTGPGEEDFTAGGGTWFVVKNGATKGMNALVGMGIGMLDDVVNSEYSAAVSTLNILAQSINAAYGSVSPTDSVVTNGGNAQTFTLTVTEGVAGYVTGLKVGESQIYTNETETIKTQTWDVTYAQVSAFGTNVTALFATKSSTTAKWLTDSFTIGNGGDYATFAAAEAADYDGDGFSNKAEAIVGTDPKNINSFLKISDISVNAIGNVVVTFQGSAAGANVPYHLYASDTVNGSYTSLTSEGKGPGTINMIVTPSTAKKFYKVVVPYTGE